MFTLRRRPRAPVPAVPAPAESLPDLVPSRAECHAASQLASVAYVESTRPPRSDWSRRVTEEIRDLLVSSAHLGEPGLDPVHVAGLVDRDLAIGARVLARAHALALEPSSASVALTALAERGLSERAAARLLDDLASGAPAEWALRRLDAPR